MIANFDMSVRARTHELSFPNMWSAFGDLLLMSIDATQAPIPTRALLTEENATHKQKRENDEDATSNQKRYRDNDWGVTTWPKSAPNGQNKGANESDNKKYAPKKGPDRVCEHRKRAGESFNHKQPTVEAVSLKFKIK